MTKKLTLNIFLGLNISSYKDSKKKQKNRLTDFEQIKQIIILIIFQKIQFIRVSCKKKIQNWLFPLFSESSTAYLSAHFFCLVSASILKDSAHNFILSSPSFSPILHKIYHQQPQFPSFSRFSFHSLSLFFWCLFILYILTIFSFYKDITISMKVLSLTILLALVIFTYSLSSHHNSHIKSHKAADPINTAVQKATEETVKYILQNPTEAAKIPSKLITGQINGLIEAFTGAWDIKDRSRSLQLTMVNGLKNKNLEYAGDYFDSGVWYETWKPQISPNSVMQGTVANSQGSFFTGVSGGIKLKISGENYWIYIGFTNPYMGSYKNYIEISSENLEARRGYDNSYDNSPKFMTLGNYKVQAVQARSTIAQMAYVYTIEQI